MNQLSAGTVSYVVSHSVFEHNIWNDRLVFVVEHQYQGEILTKMYTKFSPFFKE